MNEKQTWKTCKVCEKCKHLKKCGYKFSIPIESFHCKRFEEKGEK